MAAGFHDGSRSLQDAFDTRALADRIDGLLVTETISDGDRAFIEARDMFFLATADEKGRPTCSYKGGEPGFVRVLDPRTLVFPNYDGNGMYLSAGNVLVNPDVGMLFLDFERGHRMRLEGVAHSTSTIPCAPTTRRPSSSCGSRRDGCTPTVRATSTGTSSSGGRGSFPQRLPHPGSGVEALRVGGRRAARTRPGPRPG